MDETRNVWVNIIDINRSKRSRSSYMHYAPYTSSSRGLHSCNYNETDMERTPSGMTTRPSHAQV